MTSLECAKQLRTKVLATVDEILPVLDDRVGRSTIYDQLRAGTFIVEPVRLGRRLFVPVAPLLQALGLDEEVKPSPTNGSPEMARPGT